MLKDNPTVFLMMWSSRMKHFSVFVIPVWYILHIALSWIGKYYSFKFLNVSEVLIYYFFALKNSSPRSYTTRKSFIENHPEPKAFPCGNFGSPYSQARNRFIYNNKLQWLHLGDSQTSTIIFLVVAVLQAVQTIYLANKRASGTFNRSLLPKRKLI